LSRFEVQTFSNFKQEVFLITNEENPMKRIAVVLVFSVLLFAVAAQAQTPAPKPGAEHKRLGFYVGKWTSEGEAKASPFGPAGKTTSTENCEWFPGNFFVVTRSAGTSPSGPTHSIAIMGYNAVEKVYTYDSYSNRGDHSTSRGTVQGGIWTWPWEDKFEGKPVKGRVIVTEVSPTSYTYKAEYSMDGKAWNVLEEGKANKVK
jgi:hypothetical protein